MYDSALKPVRPWREIVEELLQEPNTERMPALLKELNQAFEEHPLGCEED